MRDADDLVDIIYGEEDELDNVWVSLVPYVADGEHRPQPHRLARDRRPGAAPTSPASARPTGGGWKGCVMAPRLSARHQRLDASRRSRSARSSTRRRPHADNNWPTINDQRHRHQPAAQTRPEPRLRHADHPADQVAGRRSRPGSARCGRGGAAAPPATSGSSGAGGRSRRGGAASGAARRPAARLRHRLHGQGRRDADRRQQRVLQPRTAPTTTRAGLGLHRLRPRQRARSRRHRPVSDAATASPSSTPG